MRERSGFLFALVLIFTLSAPAWGAPSTEHALVVTATAYNSVAEQTDANPTIAAWGDELKPGMKVVAVSRDLLERGLTRGKVLRIEGLEGDYVVLDKTASRHRKRIDIYMGVDVEKARQFGVRQVRIHWSD